MPYWNELITQKSWEKLLLLQKTGVKFVLVGGWAVWLYSRAHKSKDLDIVVDFGGLSKLKSLFALGKNDRLRKYQFELDGIDVDVYAEFFSKLAIPVEDIAKNAQKIEGFTVAKPECLLVLKQGAEIERKESEKGFKDRLDIIELLLKANIDFAEYGKLLEKYDLSGFRQRLIEIVQGFRETKYLGITWPEFKKKKQWLLERIKQGK